MLRGRARENGAAAERQLEMLSVFENRPAEALGEEDLERIFECAARPADPRVQMRAAVLLSQIYPVLAPKDTDLAQRVHTILLRDLRQPRRTLAHPSCSWLVVTHLREENLAHIPWQSAEEVASAAECFYGFSGTGLGADESHRRVRDLVRYAGLRFAEQERWEEVFQLLSRVRLPDEMMDADLFWLRNTLVLYEQRRIRRVKRVLLGVLAAVALFVLVLSPLLVMQYENPYREARGLLPLTFLDALYWSAITFTTVGYGDIVPHTLHSRLLAVANGMLGMTFMGVVAGLILGRVTPRVLP